MQVANYSAVLLIEHLRIYRGGWDTEGVTVVSNDINSSTITCNSTHLTSFAVLVDVSGGHQVWLSLSELCSKICPICFWGFPESFTYYALHFRHYACVMLKDYSIF